MLVREWKRLVLLLVPVLLIVVVTLQFYDWTSLPFSSAQISDWIHNVYIHAGDDKPQHTLQEISSITSGTQSGKTSSSSGSGSSNLNGPYTEVFSSSTTDGKFFKINFGEFDAMNPNIIPHPTFEDTWIIVAQQHRSKIQHTVWFAELVCNAAFRDNTLQCVTPPMILPIAATAGDKCTGDLAYFALNVGPHDARVFYGPRTPYALYGSNSMYTCFGQWMQDFRTLIDWGMDSLISNQDFRHPTDLQRPPPWRSIEKNWFPFWDKDGQMYVHYDLTPNRIFAKLDVDGSIGVDLAPQTASADAACMAKYMPKISLELESIHQATNSLSITLCKRSDPGCSPNDSNTFLFTIFQHKSYYSFHSEYEPYVMLFRREAPFGIHAFTRKPIWIHGRTSDHPSGGMPPPERNPNVGEGLASREAHVRTDMFYVVSMSWKKHGMKYHGYLDDELFLAFGIEDADTGGIDVLAADLLADLGLCNES
ncbi:MAG: hypothetical protein M1820_001729 [Bogoriella megaspora]|nr:MAG: hypothetical protein M1820_001729 [Bogoriella megaspora]